MRLENLIMELEAIESVKGELARARCKREAWEILGRLISLYSAVNVKELREYLETQASASEDYREAA